jgi:hypothetical protein
MILLQNLRVIFIQQNPFAVKKYFYLSDSAMGSYMEKEENVVRARTVYNRKKLI